MQENINNLIAKAKEGCANSFQKLYEMHRSLYKPSYWAVKYSYFDGDDWEQLKMIAIQRAIETYELNKGASFSSYAYFCIHNEIIDQTQKSCRKGMFVSYDHSCSVNTAFHNAVDDIIVVEEGESFFDLVLSDSGNAAANAELAIYLSEIFNMMDEGDSDVIELLLSGYKRKEVMEQLNISVCRLNLIMNRFKKIFIDGYEGHTYNLILKGVPVVKRDSLQQVPA